MVDADGSRNLTKSELVDYLERLTGFETDGHVIIDDALWDKFDVDGDGYLDAQEFSDIASRMEAEELVLEQILVYLPQDSEKLSDFEIVQESVGAHQETSESIKASNNAAELGSCEDARNFRITALQFQGEWIGNVKAGRVYEDPEPSVNAATFYGVLQTSGHCKMVRFVVRRDPATNTCQAKADDARYIDGATSCPSDAKEVTLRWLSYNKVSLAANPSQVGYGISSLDVTTKNGRIITDVCENFVLAHQSSRNIPASSAAWHAWFKGFSDEKNRTLDLLNTDAVKRCPGEPRDAVFSDAYAWFKSSMAGPNWKSAVGDFEAKVVGGSVEIIKKSGHGASKVVNAIAGGANDRVEFGAILPPTWTLCSLSRYNGSTRKRVLIATPGNTLHGHWNSRRGVAHYDTWVTQGQSRGNIDDWLIMCGTNSGARIYADGENIATADRKGSSGSKSLGIGQAGGENSDWAVAEIITWDRALDSEEMMRVTEYLEAAVLGKSGVLVDGFNELDAVHVYAQPFDPSSRNVVPMLVSRPGTNVLAIHLRAASALKSTNEKTLFERVARPGLEVRLRATSRLPDVVHVFDKPAKAKKPSGSNITESVDELGTHFSQHAPMKVKDVDIRHRGRAEKDFTDDTTVIVRGAILFPKDWVAGSTTCGLEKATIFVTEIGEEGEPDEYETDSQGWFEMALTRGKSFSLTAKFPKHTICYTGKTIQDAASEIFCEDKPLYVNLMHISDDEFVFFTDVTKGNIDLGVYQGECDAVYSGAIFKITPVNGCHRPVLQTSEQISAWMTNFIGLPTAFEADESLLPKNARVWPFAAMDYSISLHQGPTVGGFPALVEAENEKSPANKIDIKSCDVEMGDVLDFFRNRAGLERLALMRSNNDWFQVRYKYHGWICIDVRAGTGNFGDEELPKIASEHDLCLDTKTVGGLAPVHFLGETSVETDPAHGDLSALKAYKDIKVRVFEAHINAGKVERCYAAFPGVTPESGSTTIRFRQDVTSSDGDCHLSRGGGPACDFQLETVLNEQGKWDVAFPGGEAARRLECGPPNLSSNHRRSIEVEVTRLALYNALGRSTTAKVSRELIPLSSKMRGGAGGSDSTFWATVPLEGLVYTVVHDPPGGGSFAELQTGSVVAIAYELVSTRAAHETGAFEATATTGFDIETQVGFNAGWVAEGSFQVDIEGEGEGGFGVSQIGPDVSITSTKSDSWDIALTTNRVVRSSQDPGIPGRSGDTILGGGIELTYVQSDVVDLIAIKLRNGYNVSCLDAKTVITWMPRKPTTYLMSVHSIESQVLPNLKYLLSLVNRGYVEADYSGLTGSDWTTYLKTKIVAWQRTLLWSSPEVALSGGLDDYNKYVKDSAFAGAGALFKSSISEQLSTYKANRDAKDSKNLIDLANEWASYTPYDILGTSGVAAPMMAMSMGAGVLMLGFTSAMSSLLGPSVYLNAARLLIPEATMPLSHKKTGADRIQSYTTELNSFNADGGRIYDFGMTKGAVKDLNRDLDLEQPGTQAVYAGDHTAMGEDQAINAYSPVRSLSSFTGAPGPNGMYGNESAVFLSFSGGGSSMDFSFTSDEDLYGSSWSIAFDVEGGIVFKASMSTELEKPAKLGTETGAEAEYGRHFGNERSFQWNRRGQLTTTYSLMDDQYGDKFVISVGGDKRFGTPVFTVMGGRSMCPGEPGTVWRESDVSLVIRSKLYRDLNPNQRAVYSVIVKNESPYREGGSFVLRLADGLFTTIDEMRNAAYAAADEDPHNASAVFLAARAAAKGTIAELSADVVRILKEADDTASANPNDAFKTADALNAAARTSPPVYAGFGDAVFQINGKPLTLGEVQHFNFIEGDSLETQSRATENAFTLTIDPGSMKRIEYITMSVQSACETDMDLYRDPISHTTPLPDASNWLVTCPKAMFTEKTMATYAEGYSASPSAAQPLELKIFNPDPTILWPDEKHPEPSMNFNLGKVHVQYRPVSGGEWITAKSAKSTLKENFKFNIICPDSMTEGCSFDWNLNNDYEKMLSGFKDNLYEVRVKSFCSGGGKFASTDVHEFVSDQRLFIKVDTGAPLAKMTFSSFQHTFGVEFLEDIDCTKTTADEPPRELHKVDITKVNTKCAGAGTSIQEKVSEEQLRTYRIKCINQAGTGKWVVEFPPEAHGQYDVRVKGVTDVAANEAQPFSILADVRCADAESEESSAYAVLGSTAFAAGTPVFAKVVLRPSTPMIVAVVSAALALAVTILRRRKRPSSLDDSASCTALNDARVNYGAALAP